MDMLERTAAQSAALADELRNVVRQAEKLVHAIGEDREDALKELREHLGVALVAAKQRLADFEVQAKRFRDNAGVAVDGFVQENPWTAVGIGTAVGLILGSWVAGGRE
jgi:ElaB/YqjD/DUF883 family membrane-anchored ribosome-binding protein